MNRIRDLSGFLYLATPYTNYPYGHRNAFMDACMAAGRLIEDGFHVYCPIAHTHPIAAHAGMDAVDHELWMEVDRPFMEAAVGLLVVCMPGWRESKGVAYEILFFQNRKKPVVYLNWPDLQPCDGDK